MAGKKRNGPQQRSRAARNDADIGAIETDIESVYGLPAGSVQIVDPATGRNIRNDAKVRTLRRKSEG
jgi:hypothetical protein